jgi:hypothetical protein
MSKEQTFRSERSLSPRLIRLRRKWVSASERTSIIGSKMKCKAYNGEVRSSEKDFETLQLGAFATPGLLLAQGHEDLTAESGLNSVVAVCALIAHLLSVFAKPSRSNSSNIELS